MSSHNQPHSPKNHIHIKALPSPTRGPYLIILASLILITQAVLLTSCAKPRPLPTMQDLRGRAYSDDEILDISLTIILLSPARRRALLSAEDPDVWVADYWRRTDPSPDTPENEALEVFRQRAEYLQARFPDTFLNEILEPWLSFLKNGHWDWIQSGMLAYSLRRVDRIRPGAQRDSFLDTSRLATDVLQYSVPVSYEVVLKDDKVMRGTERPRIPHLRQVWEILEDPDARRRQKVDALQRIAWFETRAFAQRLLEIPDSTLADVRAELDECFRRMAVRRSYCLGAEGARRLAAIAAAGAPPKMQLSRTIDDEYSSDQFLTDLSLLLRIRSEEDHPTIRGPHPRLRTKPEEFLGELAERFPTSKSVTGWDWRGDLYLALGPAQYCQDAQHLAHYVYGYPASYGIRAGVLGAVDAVPAGGRIQTHIDDYYRNSRRRRTQVQTAIDELKAAIPEASTATTALLGHLHRLLPPRAVSAGMLIPDIALDISADVVVFPDSTESLDMMASIGIPFDELYMSISGPGLRTLLETCCFLLRAPQYIVWSERHDGGFVFERPSGSTKHLHLVDTFRCRVEPEDYILYCSALDPITGKSGGIVLFLDLQTEETAGPILSPIALADKVDSEVTEEAFVRGGYRIVPYPGRNLLYGEDIWLYFEIRGLEKSDYGDYAWEESYYFIPDHINAGIVRISPGMIHNSIRASAERSFMIDLATMESQYQGPIIIVILITDVVSGRNALTAARFTISRR